MLVNRSDRKKKKNMSRDARTSIYNRLIAGWAGPPPPSFCIYKSLIGVFKTASHPFFSIVHAPVVAIVFLMGSGVSATQTQQRQSSFKASKWVSIKSYVAFQLGPRATSPPSPEPSILVAGAPRHFFCVVPPACLAFTHFASVHFLPFC